MNADRVEVRKGDYDFNNATLREGVEGVRCTVRVTFPRDGGSIEVCEEAKALLDDERERISSAEVYLSGAVNLFVQNPVTCACVAVIRLRPILVPLARVNI
jgi:hypothetical protein